MPLGLKRYQQEATANEKKKTDQIAATPKKENIENMLPLDMVELVLGIVALRFALRGVAVQSAGALHVSIAEITDAFLLLAVGLVCAQRLEMALRATRLIAAARGS